MEECQEILEMGGGGGGREGRRDGRRDGNGRRRKERKER